MAEQGELNKGLSFYSLQDWMQKSFLPKPAPVLMRLERGEMVYKWTEFDLVKKADERKQERVSEFWCPWKPVQIGSIHAPGFEELRTRYRNVDASVGRPQEFARARLAVKLNWNDMTSITKARFKGPVWGFIGRAKYQRIYDPNKGETPVNVFFLGGDYQLCIPNLTPHWVEEV